MGKENLKRRSPPKAQKKTQNPYLEQIIVAISPTKKNPKKTVLFEARGWERRIRNNIKAELGGR